MARRAVLAAGGVRGVRAVGGRGGPGRTAQQPAVEYAQRMQWFADAKFGIFIHWGIYSVAGITESRSFFDGDISYADYMSN